MKKIDLGQTITILANIGVLVGIGFLAIEIQQTNELMESEARFNRLSITTEARNILSTNGELAEIYVKASNNEPLTEVEAYRFRMSQLRALGNFEWIFREMPEGSRDREFVENQLVLSLGTDGLRRQVFLDSRENYDPDFVRWIEANILAP